MSVCSLHLCVFSVKEQCECVWSVQEETRCVWSVGGC